MLRRILVPLDPSPFSGAAQKYAIGLAKAVDAEIAGLTILDAPDIERSVGHVTPGAIEYARKAERRKEALAHEHIQEILNQFADRCDKAGVRHTELEVQGHPADRIIRESVFFDLVVMGMETHYHFETSDAPCKTLDEIAGHMMPPVIVVPLEGYDPVKTSNITIAFGGSKTAARSVRQFVGLGLFKEATVTILCSNPEIEIANLLMGAVTRYLNAHRYQKVAHAWTPGPVIEAMQEQYLEPAQLVVMGANAKHGILSFLYGGVTKFLLKDGSTPLFIAN